MEFRQARLANGLELIAEINPSAYSLSIGFFVRTGSRNENDAIAGVSHFLEHMAFKGFDTLSAEDVNRRFDEMGADANAFTTEEMTVFYASLLPDLQDEALELLAGLLRPALRPDDFETEKQVILEEIDMYEDQPPFGADDRSRELFFAGHPLGSSVLGTPRSISRLTLDDMRGYFQRRYVPKKIVLVAAGRVDFDRLLAQAERSCGAWIDGDEDRQGDELRRIRGARGRHRILKPSAVQQYILLLSDAPSTLDKDCFAAGILANMLGDETGSRLYWELVDSGLADSAGIAYCEYFDNGCFVTSLSGEPEAAEDILRRTRLLCEEAAKKGFTKEERDRAVNKVLSRLVLGNERPGGRLFSLGTDWLTRREYRSIRRDREEIERVTLQDVHAVLEKYPLGDPLMVSVGPLEEIGREEQGPV